MRLMIAAVTVLATTIGAFAQQQAPTFATTKVEGTDNVYIFRNGNHQSMFIVTKAGVIATDPIAYGRPTGGQTYVDEIKKVTNQPILIVRGLSRSDRGKRSARIPSRYSALIPSGSS